MSGKGDKAQCRSTQFKPRIIGQEGEVEVRPIGDLFANVLCFFLRLLDSTIKDVLLCPRPQTCKLS